MPTTTQNKRWYSLIIFVIDSFCLCLSFTSEPHWSHSAKSALFLIHSLIFFYLHFSVPLCDDFSLRQSFCAIHEWKYCVCRNDLWRTAAGDDHTIVKSKSYVFSLCRKQHDQAHSIYFLQQTKINMKKMNSILQWKRQNNNSIVCCAYSDCSFVILRCLSGDWLSEACRINGHW